MDFYFTNRQFELQEIVSTNNSTAIVMAGEEDKLSIENGSRTLTGTLYFTNKQSAQVKMCAAIGNYILYHDKNNKDVWMTIVEIEHNPLSGTHTFVAEDAGLDLLNELVGPYNADKAYPISYYIEKFTFDSGFELGFNEIPKLTRKLEWESEDSTALARVLSVATQFDNAEIEFSFSIENTKVLKKYINVYKKRGKDNRQTLYVNVDVNNIVVKSDIYELATAIYAQGGTPDGKNSPINLKGYKWTDPDGRYELTSSSGILKDKENGAKWSRLLPGQANPNGAYIVRRKSYETTNQKTLLDSALRELKKVSEPVVNYEVDIADLPDGVNIGDTIYLVDENEEVYLSARVLELTYKYSIDSYAATLGDYLIQQGGVSQSLIDLANDLREQASRKKYDVKLEATTTTLANEASTAKIIAKVYDGALDVSTNFSKYKWTRMNSKGVIDPNWSNITNTVTAVSDSEPLWTYICEVSNLLDDGTSYLIGTDRITIANLANDSIGKPGKPGEDGKTSYFHTAYANDQNGKDFSTTDSDRSWMGTYSDFEPLDSSDYTKYAWSLIKGEKGPQGNPTGVTESATVPSSPYVGMLWKCTGDIAGYINPATYRWNGSAWEIYQFTAQNILAETFTGFVFQGVKFIGSEFISNYSITKDSKTVEGSLSIGNGNVLNDYSDSDGVVGKFTIDESGAIINQRMLPTGIGEKYELTPYSLALDGETYRGSINAKELSRLNAVGEMIWSGGWHMSASQTVTPYRSLSSCLTGWLLEFQGFSSNVAQDTDYSYVFVPKSHPVYHSGRPISPAVTVYGGAITRKILYITDTTIKGHANNAASPASGAILTAVYVN